MNKYAVFSLLSLASFMAVMMIVLRAGYSGSFIFLFLVWNLFLAWLPVVFAFLAVHWQTRPFLAATFGFFWLLFLPNAPYLVTDLIHLRPQTAVPLWYDLILLFSFALLGLILGLFSLSLVHAVFAERFGRAAGWSFVLLVMGLSGVGVSIGRYLRWNSWDIFISPLALLRDVWLNLGEPRLIALSSLLAGMLLFGYLLIGFWSRPAVVRSLSHE